MTDKQPPLDIELLDESAEVGVEGLRELVDLYFAQATETLVELRKAIMANRPEVVDQLAHKLAGSSAVCGANAVIGPLRALEASGRACDLSHAGQLVARVNERLNLCHRLLDEYLADKGV